MATPDHAGCFYPDANGDRVAYAEHSLGTCQGGSNVATPMSFAYKADLIYEVMVTQRREPTLTPYDQKPAPDVIHEDEPMPAPCLRCAGTGMFITAIVNGKPAGPGGICYRCAGKGFQTERDARRNWGYDNFGQRVDIDPRPADPIVAVFGDRACARCLTRGDHRKSVCDDRNAALRKEYASEKFDREDDIEHREQQAAYGEWI